MVTRPYETYRRIIEHGSMWELGIIAMLLSIYFLTASLVKVPLFRFFLLTREFIVLAGAVFLTFLIIVTLFWLAGRVVGSRGAWRRIAIGWGYGLLPTLFWFWMTSLLYVLIPPPRTTSVWGVTFSVLFLLISIALLSWKIILSYLTLRFALKLDLGKIILICCLVFPVMGLYSVGMYKWGVFRVPFL